MAAKDACQVPDLRESEAARIVNPARPHGLIRQAVGRNYVMNAKNNLTIDGETRSAVEPAAGYASRDGNVWPWINWGLALTTVPAAAIVMLFALGAVMSTDGCTDSRCSNLGRGGIDFDVAFYGAPVVAFVVLVISFVTAKRRGGIVVPLCGWALLVVDVALMAASVSS
jgi:hypothetical protein